MLMQKLRNNLEPMSTTLNLWYQAGNSENSLYMHPQINILANINVSVLSSLLTV